MELDLEARLVGETLVLNRSLDPFFEDYIELNNLNVQLKLRRNQVDDLMPTIEEGELVEEFRARNDARMVSKVFGYPSDCDHDKKIHIDCAYNLKFSYMIDFAVLEDMDSYRDEGMGDVIFGEPLLREVGINARRLIPSCCVIFDLEPLSLSFDFVFDFEIFKSFLVQFRRTSLTGFPAQSVRSSNADALDSPYLLVLNTGTSQSRKHDMSESDSYYLSD
ncbi:hypothetical protein Tco_0982666 [Tanacetum coccineum]